MIPSSIKTILTQRIPENLIKEREQGKTKLSYISGSTVIGLLNQAFDYNWNWVVEKEWIQESENKFKADNNYYKAPDDRAAFHNGKRGEWEIQPPVAHARGVLTVKYQDTDGNLQTIIKTGHGSKVIIGGASEQDSIFKAASTDALKKAATMLGVGLELYRDENETAYFEAIEYVDPWTDEEKAKHQAELNFIEEFKTRFENGDEAISQYVYAFSNATSSSMSFITPKNIAAFVAYCQSIN